MYGNEFDLRMLELEYPKYFICESLPNGGYAGEIQHDNLESIEPGEQTLRLRSRYQIFVPISHKFHRNDCLSKSVFIVRDKLIKDFLCGSGGVVVQHHSHQRPASRCT